MTELLTAAQMRAIEQAAIESGEVTGLELMERAGRGVVEAIFEEWPGLRATSHRAVVLCGPGNNGGDGFVVARLLKEWGWDVEVFLFGDPDKLPPDARTNYDRWLPLGPVEPLSIESGLVALESGSDVVVDALFGTGLARPVDLMPLFGAIYELREWSTEGQLKRPTHVVAIDLPSGLCSDSGKPIGEPTNKATECAAAHAHLTVSFHREKAGHRLSEGPAQCGKTVVADIGLGSRRGTGIEARLADGSEQRLGKFLGHKYTHGHAVILSGGPGKTGAARLAARGALRIGAGLVTLAGPQSALAEIARQVTAVMCRSLDGAPGLREMLEDARFNALCLGPGMGLGPDTQALVVEALKAKRGTVLDADALTRFERNPEALFEILHKNCVLTPHAGEFKRLFPDIAEKLEAPATTGPAYSKVDATREAAARAGCTVLFKGPDTVIADQTGRCSISSSAYERAAPWLATAGAGDVLAGFITGLLARGFGPMQAAETAAWLHTECALSFGPGLIAEDLAEELPKVFRRLLEPPA
ncbi:MAG: NAD(P)H-hydrate dehydratase [Paracoccaceae bacterium]|nr:NAD(P)H-hydrate dehydratase [Paracoccaceae bacterium]